MSGSKLSLTSTLCRTSTSFVAHLGYMLSEMRLKLQYLFQACIHAPTAAGLLPLLTIVADAATTQLLLLLLLLYVPPTMLCCPPRYA
jgi:hypothetical protein